MRVVAFMVFMLSACGSQGVRCDGRMRPINLPVAGAVGGVDVSEAATGAVSPLDVPHPGPTIQASGGSAQ